MTPASSWRRHGWLLVPFAFFWVYLLSFSAFPAAIESKVSVVGEADAASYSLLYREFELGRPIGNPFNLDNRSIADVAQKHKLHHVLSAALGRGLHDVVAPLYELLGVPRARAVYLPGALLGALNVVLLGLLLRRWNPRGNSTVPFLVFFGISLSPWLYTAVPDSWPLTIGLFLTFLLLAESDRMPTLGLAALLGVFMLNNMAIAALVGVLWLREWRRAPLSWPLIGRAALALGLAVGVWLAGLSLLALFDPGFRPDRYWAFSRWFRDFMGARLPPTDPYVWKSMLSNLFVNSVVTNQPDPNMPQEAMQHTIRSSLLGVAAIVALLGLGATALWRLARHAIAQARTGGARGLLTHPALFPALWCVVMVMVTLALYYAGGFTYATLTVPMMAALLCSQLDLGKPLERVLVWGAVLLIVINNLDQVRQFRDALSRIS